jgi:hypothetical protein
MLKLNPDFSGRNEESQKLVGTNKKGYRYDIISVMIVVILSSVLEASFRTDS